MHLLLFKFTAVIQGNKTKVKANDKTGDKSMTIALLHLQSKEQKRRGPSYRREVEKLFVHIIKSFM